MGTIPSYPLFVPLEIPTAAKLNQIKTAGDFWATAPQVYAYQTATTNFATSGTYALVAFDTEIYDTDTMHDLVTNPSRIICQTAGKLRFGGQMTFAANATGVRQLSIRKNAAGSVVGGTQVGSMTMPAVSGSATTVMIEPFLIPMSIGDYIEVFGNQTSGGALASVASQSNSWFSAKLESA